MLTRIMHYLKALFGIKMDQWEDPEVLLKQAQEEMTEAHQKNRERAIQAITQRNNLQHEVDETTKQVNNLQLKAELALKNGNRDLARQLLVEKQTLDTSLTGLNESLVKANEICEQVKIAMKREEEAIKTRATQAMVMKTQLKQAQIENSINKALDSMEGVGSQDQAFARAQAKIGALTSESAARTELGKTRISSQLADLNDLSANAAAEDELSALEQKLGLAPAPVKAPITTAVSSVDQEFAELEQKLGTSTNQAPK